MFMFWLGNVSGGPSSDIIPFDPFSCSVDCGGYNTECVLLSDTMKSIKRWLSGMKDLRVQVVDYVLYKCEVEEM